MPDEDVQDGGGGGNFLTARFLGLPLIVWIGIAAVVAYLWFSRRSGSTSGVGTSVTTSGGGGSASAGRTTIDKGAVQITVTQGSQKQPQPPVRKKKSLVAVPNVLQQDYPQAAETIQDAGLKAERIRPYVGATTVERPSPGKKVKRGSVVKLSGSDRPDYPAK